MQQRRLLQLLPIFITVPLAQMAPVKVKIYFYIILWTVKDDDYDFLTSCTICLAVWPCPLRLFKLCISFGLNPFFMLPMTKSGISTDMQLMKTLCALGLTKFTSNYKYQLLRKVHFKALWAEEIDVYKVKAEAE